MRTTLLFSSFLNSNKANLLKYPCRVNLNRDKVRFSFPYSWKKCCFNCRKPLSNTLIKSKEITIKTQGTLDLDFSSVALWIFAEQCSSKEANEISYTYLMIKPNSSLLFIQCRKQSTTEKHTKNIMWNTWIETRLIISNMKLSGSITLTVGLTRTL